MMNSWTRRRFLNTTMTGFSAALIPGLPLVSAAQAKIDSAKVKLSDDIEPLVKLLEESDRAKLMETLAGKIRGGTNYQQILTALLLAGVRNVQPRPVGFKFHAVLVVNSCHMASISSPDEDRWLPIFWALDNFKSAQAQNKKEGDWSLGPVDEQATPPAHQAQAAFLNAMDNWDEAAADAAIASLARTDSLHSIFEIFFKLGARDFRDIGHKAIYVANAYRTLQVIGAQHAEPVLRSLAYALLQHEGENPARRDGDPDRPGRLNWKLAAEIRDDWRGGKSDPAAVVELIQTLRDGDEGQASRAIVTLLNRGVSARSIWDAIFHSAGELLMRQPGIVGIHVVTSANALHFAYQNAQDDHTRRFLMLQAAAFVPLFRKAMISRGKLTNDRLDAVVPQSPAPGSAALAEIFSEISRKPGSACAKTLAYLREGGSTDAFITSARRNIFLKGTDSHDYKFSSAALEDYRHLGPAIRDRYLAACVYRLRGSNDKNNPLVERIREAFTR